MFISDIHSTNEDSWGFNAPQLQAVGLLLEPAFPN